MNDDRFKSIVEGSIAHIRHSLVVKGKEYSRGDRLSNFKRAGKLSHSTPEMSLRGMLTKHIISIYDMIDDLAEKPTSLDLLTWDEKIGDTINYMILLKALIYERYGDKKKNPS